MTRAIGPLLLCLAVAGCDRSGDVHLAVESGFEGPVRLRVYDADVVGCATLEGRFASPGFDPAQLLYATLVQTDDLAASGRFMSGATAGQRVTILAWQERDPCNLATVGCREVELPREGELTVTLEERSEPICGRECPDSCVGLDAGPPPTDAGPACAPDQQCCEPDTLECLFQLSEPGRCVEGQCLPTSCTTERIGEACAVDDPSEPPGICCPSGACDPGCEPLVCASWMRSTPDRCEGSMLLDASDFALGVELEAHLRYVSPDGAFQAASGDVVMWGSDSREIQRTLADIPWPEPAVRLCNEERRMCPDLRLAFAAFSVHEGAGGSLVGWGDVVVVWASAPADEMAVEGALIDAGSTRSWLGADRDLPQGISLWRWPQGATPTYISDMPTVMLSTCVVPCDGPLP